MGHQGGPISPRLERDAGRDSSDDRASARRPEPDMAQKLENGTYLLDERERQDYAAAARMLDRVGHPADLTRSLADFDYLLLMCAHLILTGEQGVDETLERIVKQC